MEKISFTSVRRIVIIEKKIAFFVYVIRRKLKGKLHFDSLFLLSYIISI